jgi:hypothetical protein
MVMKMFVLQQEVYIQLNVNGLKNAKRNAPMLLHQNVLIMMIVLGYILQPLVIVGHVIGETTHFHVVRLSEKTAV